MGTIFHGRGSMSSLALSLPPFASWALNPPRTKAVFAGRVGPPVLQAVITNSSSFFSERPRFFSTTTNLGIPGPGRW